MLRPTAYAVGGIVIMVDFRDHVRCRTRWKCVGPGLRDEVTVFRCLPGPKAGMWLGFRPSPSCPQGACGEAEVFNVVRAAYVHRRHGCP